MLTNDIVLIATLGLIAGTFFLVFLCFLAMMIFNHFKRAHYMKNFSDYRAILEYNLEKAYDMIHKEHILTYSLDAYRVDDDDYDKISKEFVRLVGKLCGPILLKEFVLLYGDEQNYTFNLLEYFSTRYENDEIRNQALEQITDTDIDEQLPSYKELG